MQKKKELHLRFDCLKMQVDDVRRKRNAGKKIVIKDDSDESDDNAGKRERESSSDVDDDIIFVPNNPKEWSQKHIETWINWASKKFRLTPVLDVARFPKNAEELASYSKADFYIICGSFEGGHKVSQHYKYMMQNAHEVFDETLLTDGEPGKLP